MRASSRRLRCLEEEDRAKERGRSMAATLLEAAPVTRALVWLAAPDGHPTDVSRPYREYFGIPEGERGQWNWFWAVHPCDLRRVLHAWQSAVQNGKAFRAQFQLRRADGAYRLHHGK